MNIGGNPSRWTHKRGEQRPNKLHYYQLAHRYYNPQKSKQEHSASPLSNLLLKDPNRSSVREQDYVEFGATESPVVRKHNKSLSQTVYTLTT